jgi:hypothetical protein
MQAAFAKCYGASSGRGRRQAVRKISMGVEPQSAQAGVPVLSGFARSMRASHACCICGVRGVEKRSGGGEDDGLCLAGEELAQAVAIF